MKQTAFDYYHPVLALVYFVGCLAVGMAALQPVFILAFASLSFLNAILNQGARKAVKLLLYQVPLILVITVANPFFSASGSTEVARLGFITIYAESLLFGLSMGVLLAGVFLCMSNAVSVVSSDKMMACLGGVLPTVALMVSMVCRLVPAFVRRGRTVQNVHLACTAARLSSDQSSPKRCSPRAKRLSFARLSSVIMAWGMEDSLQTADAMKARGWGATSKRTSYTRYCFGVRDALAMSLVFGLLVVSALSAGIATASFAFYPVLSGWTSPFLLVGWLLYLALPIVFEGIEALAWHQ